MVRKLLGTKDQFHRRQFSHRSGVGLVSGPIQAHYICGDLGYCDISSTSDHEALDPGGWKPADRRSGSAVDEIWLGHDQHGAVCGSEALLHSRGIREQESLSLLPSREEALEGTYKITVV